MQTLSRETTASRNPNRYIFRLVKCEFNLRRLNYWGVGEIIFFNFLHPPAFSNSIFIVYTL